MNKLCELLAIVAIYIFSASPILSEVTSTMPPQSIWEQQPEGIAVALTFVTHKEDGVRKSLISLYIKNISGTIKEFDPDSIARGLEISNNKGDNNWVPLRTIDPRLITRSMSYSLAPGKTVTYPIELNLSELKTVRSKTVRLNVWMFDMGTGQRFKIESSPKLLTEAVQ